MTSLLLEVFSGVWSTVGIERINQSLRWDFMLPIYSSEAFHFVQYNLYSHSFARTAHSTAKILWTTNNSSVFLLFYHLNWFDNVFYYLTNLMLMVQTSKYGSSVKCMKIEFCFWTHKKFIREALKNVKHLVHLLNLLYVIFCNFPFPFTLICLSS